MACHVAAGGRYLGVVALCFRTAAKIVAFSALLERDLEMSSCSVSTEPSAKALPTITATIRRAVSFSPASVDLKLGFFFLHFSSLSFFFLWFYPLYNSSNLYFAIFNSSDLYCALF